jgi:hypothetical protein
MEVEDQHIHDPPADIGSLCVGAVWCNAGAATTFRAAKTKTPLPVSTSAFTLPTDIFDMAGTLKKPQ